MQYELSQVSKLYRQGPATIRAVDSVDLAIDAGEFVIIAGASGSGKSTLLQLLGALDRPSSGKLSFEGDDLATMADRRLADLRLRAFGFVFQQFNLIPTLTAAENVEAALAPAGRKHHDAHDRALELLDQVGLSERAAHLPGQLSGGEQQRVAIARALANNPRVILADEPTGNLDTATGASILDLLTSVAAAGGHTVFLVTHDPLVAARAPRVLAMRDGQLREDAGEWATAASPTGAATPPGSIATGASSRQAPAPR